MTVLGKRAVLVTVLTLFAVGHSGSGRAESLGKALRRIERQVARVPVAPVNPVKQISPALRTVLAPPAVVENTIIGKLYEVELDPALETTLAQEIKASAGDAAVPLPGAIRQKSADGSEMTLKLFVYPGRPLIRSATGDFEGSVILGVARASSDNSSQKLSAGVLFQVMDPSLLASPVTVDYGGLPYSEMKIRARSVSDRLSVRIATQFDLGGVTVELPVQDAVEVHVSKRELEGFGLEGADVNLQLVGAKLAGPRYVTLSAVGGDIDPSRVLLDGTGFATAHIRAESVGPVEVTAKSSGLSLATETLSSRAPILTLGAGLGGGLVGGLMRQLTNRRQRKLSQRISEIIAALLVGFVVTAFWTVGVNLLPVSPNVKVGFAVLFSISALGAFAGPKLLDLYSLISRMDIKQARSVKSTGT